MNGDRIIGISFIVAGVLVWLFGPVVEQFKDFTTVIVLIIGLVVFGAIMIIKSRKKKIKSP